MGFGSRSGFSGITGIKLNDPVTPTQPGSAADKSITTNLSPALDTPSVSGAVT